MPVRLRARSPVVMVCLLALTGASLAQRGSTPASLPGPMGGGVTLLPNGWRIQPVGRHFSIGSLPLNMVLSPDGRSLIVSNNGYEKPTLRVMDLDRETVATTSLDDAWLGLAWHPDGKRLYSSAAAANAVTEVAWANSRLRVAETVQISPSSRVNAPGTNRPPAQSFVGGVAVSPDGTRLYAVHVLGKLVNAIDTVTRKVISTVNLPAEPYTCVITRDGSTLVVSLWGGAKLLFFDAKTMAPKGEVTVGEHPNAMMQSADGKLMYVACANTNAVWVVDLASQKATLQIAVALFPTSPPGSTPNALALSPNGRQLLVANADNNAVAVIDVSPEGGNRVAGFIPTGWYPTGVLYSRDGSEIYILSGKGLTSGPNPRGMQAGIPGAPGQYSGGMLEGSLSIVRTPDTTTLDRYTRIVYDVTPFTEANILAPANAPSASPIPGRVGGPSPIKHVFYIIRENRTYDQILGDLGRGNGDPTIALFGENITPNAHALAREFVTLDNFYVNAEVSYDGHAFSTGAYATDVVQKFWPLNYAKRGAAYLSEGGGDNRNAYGNIAAPINGYIWDSVIRAGKTVRSYGEFVTRDNTAAPWAEPSTDTSKLTGARPVKASVPGLVGRIHPAFPPFDLSITDNARADIWEAEFKLFVANGQLPALSIIRLGGDHTNGTSATAPTPRAMIADNDLALGRIVETISKSKYWADSAIFVLEDDAQNGPDHVDAHRSVAFVASPFARRGVVDSTLYTTSGMLRTMELILGCPPMSQYDAAATPMYNAFQATAVGTGFTHQAARISLTEMNRPGAPGSAASDAMDFSDADRTPELELNEILWMSVHGAQARMPPPVHAAFIRPQGSRTGDGDDDDDDRPAPPKAKAKPGGGSHQP